MSGICLRWQDVRGERLVFSCECAGEGCPDDPRRNRPRSSRPPMPPPNPLLMATVDGNPAVPL